MADDVVRDIPEEMVEKGAAADYAAVAGAPVSPVQAADRAAPTVPGWDAMLGDATAVLDRAYSYLSTRDLAADVLSAALAGRQVVALPEPDEVHDAAAEARWYTPPDSDAAMTAYLNATGVPEVVTADDDYWSPDDLERDGLARIAAARYARRLAAGSRSGED